MSTTLDFKYYTAPDLQVYGFLADGSQDHLIPDDYVLVSSDGAKTQGEANTQAKIDLLSYAEKRSFEYPPIADYLDGVVKGDQAQIDAYIAACLAVKAKFPKT